MGCGGGSVSFLRIPGNIKQDFAPFQAVPGGGMQKFTFKNSRKAQSGCHINMVPSSISKNTTLFNNDLSFKHQKIAQKFENILDLLPSITIREYLPDTKLDQSLNFFQDMYTNIFKGHEKKEQQDPGKETTDTAKKSKDLTDKLKNVVNKIMEKIDSEGWLSEIAPDDVEGQPGGSGKEYTSIVKFPFFLYSKLQSCTTTNIYELPCVPANNAMYNSNGHPGWDGNGYMRLLPDVAKNIPVLGKMLDTLFGNLGINFTPWWDAASGTRTPGPEIELKFSLFNDSKDAAIANFIFVQTIIAHSRWIQYGIMQHSSSLYDVSLAGIGKQYACMGTFDVMYKGTLRTPSEQLLSELVSKVGSRYPNKTNVANTLTIKIPDVYDVSMKFQSLLPQNFNTFIYNFAQQDMMTMATAKQESGFTRLTNAIKELKELATGLW